MNGSTKIVCTTNKLIILNIVINNLTSPYTLYPTQNAVKVYADSKVTNAIVDGVTDVAPSQNAVFNALDLKQNTLTNPITGTGANGQVALEQAGYEVVNLIKQ